MTGVQALERAAPTQPLRPGLVLHFTPKHASWLNQIALWFSILARKVLRRASFTSVANLKQRISAFIDFFNKRLAKPFRCTSEGKRRLQRLLQGPDGLLDGSAGAIAVSLQRVGC
jgi:hypothetical protein